MVGEKSAFVGREAEVGRLQQLVTRAEEGIGTLVLISGEAGIGKTRLCTEVHRLCRDRGAQSVLGRASIEDASVPFAPLGDTLRAARRSEPGLWEAARARGSVLWPTASELAPEPGHQRSLDRPVLFESMLDAVEDAAGDRVTLWTIEDIHWADDSTWEFIRYAARRIADLGLVLVVTYRDEEIGPGHTWWTNLVRLKREPSAQTVALARLRRPQAVRMVRAIAPALSDELVDRIVERAAGTPLVIEELAGLASRSGRVPAVPDVIRATVRERRERLCAESRSLLDAAAVAGFEVDCDFLKRLHPAGLLDDLLSVGLLLRDDEQIRFRHPLMQEAAYADISGERRRDLHAQVAAALLRSAQGSVELIATHLERADRPGEALSELLTAAGEASEAGSVGRAATLRLGAHHLASRHESLAERRQLVQALAIRDLFAAGRWSELGLVIDEAWPARHRLLPHARAQLAATAAWRLYWSDAILEASVLLDKELAEFARRGDLDEAAELLTVAGTIAWWTSGDGAKARRLLGKAMAAARATGDVEVESRARCTDMMVTYGLDRRADVAAEHLRDVASFARAHTLTVAESLARLYLAMVTWKIEDAREAVVFSARTGAWTASTAVLLESWLLLLAGRRREAEDVFGGSRAELRLAVPTIAVVAAAVEACLFLHRGDLNEARQLLDGPRASSEASRKGWFAALWSAARGWLAWEEQRWEDAAMHLARSADQCAVGNNVTMGGRPIFLALHVDAHLRLGQKAGAMTAIESSSRFIRKLDPAFDAAVAAARFRLSPTRFSALEAERLAGLAPWPWMRAVVACWRGELLEDPEGAEQARAEFNRIGARRGVQRAERVFRRVGVGRTRGESRSSSLSPRELEVAELVADGLSNPAIARRLYLSRPTVATHVAHILTKLDFSSRAEIAAWIGKQRSQDP